MSILKKPYTISVWDDVWDGEKFVEKRLGVIGSDKMIAQCRAIEPNLVRNVNGSKKFSFKMYKHYVDTMTGEKVENPFIGWLISERKVKLEYKGKWYDFIIKDINENSSNYLYTYQLEDALVQELSKNGFGVTLDAALMNNTGDAKELGQYVMAETDWTVEGEVAVQTIEEALVYIELPEGQRAVRLFDQASGENGVTEGTTVDLGGETVLAFYSSCKNKPHRFQFIYLDEYSETIDDKIQPKLARNKNRVIIEKDCQYYIDFNTPESDYSNQGDAKYNLFLPNNFSIVEMSGSDGSDTTISTWYRGNRYSYAQQAVYVPALEQYCQKYRKEELISEPDGTPQMHYEGTNDSISKNGDIYTKTTRWSGLKFVLNYDPIDTYVVSYTLEKTTGDLINIGGHAKSFEIKEYNVYTEDGELIGTTTEDRLVLNNEYSKIKVVAKYKKITPTTEDGTPYIFIQPNRGLNNSISFKITDLTVKVEGEYLGYTDTNFVSPTLIQNCITNPKFESKSGWTATAAEQDSGAQKASVQNVYGRFNNSKFVTITDEFISGEYSETATYLPYMEMEFFNAEQFVLNTGIKDNRTMIGNMPKDEEWILDYEIYGEDGGLYTGFELSLGEYIYDVSTNGYSERTGFINFSEVTASSSSGRKVFKVALNTYTEETFKKNCKVALKLQLPNSTEFDEDNNGKVVPKKFYIKKIALYRKVIGANGAIITPDYEEENSLAAENYVEQGTLEKRYNYFREWDIDDSNPDKCTSKSTLNVTTRTELNYTDYKPVYNEGAKKVRSVTVKESNYFNILQSIAETFEQWMVLDIVRNENTGAIESKKIIFKNYAGKNNYACFRYGVNLKDIQRTYTSKNIVTKLIVKQNNNEHANNGFCTIQRAGANPTGENYIYDFQYYQNTGIMRADDYLNDNYYLTGAAGDDAELWTGNEVSTGSLNTKGYFPRIKKINEALIPIADEVAGLKTDLVQRKAELEVANATNAAAAEGIETVREDFKTLTGLYPEEAQNNDLAAILPDTTKSLNGVVAQESWYKIEATYAGTGTDDAENGLKYDNTLSVGNVKIKVIAQKSNKAISAIPRHGQAVTVETTSTGTKITKSGAWDGTYIEADYKQDKEYILTYKLTVDSGNAGKITRIGGHNGGAFNDYTISISGIAEDVVTPGGSTSYTYLVIDNGLPEGEYTITMRGKYNKEKVEGSDYFWIQPNRGIDEVDSDDEDTDPDPISYIISNISLVEVDGIPAEQPNDRMAHLTLYTKAEVAGVASSISRKYTVNIAVPGGETTVEVTQVVAAVDMTRSDVAGYINELVTYREKLENSGSEKTSLEPIIANKEAAIREKEERYKNLLEWKQALNKEFFKKYSRFIQEGTWMSEEYTDDEKYYADSLSVMYNSCYPQAAYQINVLALSALEGYETFEFDIGDKTWAIDEEFFGSEDREEVIITELSEMLDDPSKDQIKVQNFKNQFQDLFQKITATVQQTQYNAGSYERGAALLDASIEKKNEFITNAINDAQSYLKFGQTVKQGADGITITDSNDATNQLKLVGGAILFSTKNPETDEWTWRTGLTNKGITADLITAGQLNTGAVQIMSGDSPTFRWDAYGISAYDAHWYTDSNAGISTISGINKNKFVRFDKNGIYGINNPGINGADWHPTVEGEVEDKAAFYLTWDGMQVIPGNLVYTKGPKTSGDPAVVNVSPNDFRLKMGRVDDYIYNTWGDNGIPYYDGDKPNAPKFVKVFSVGDYANSNAVSENFVIYSDGTVVSQSLKLNGSIEWTEASSPSKNVYCSKRLSKPANGTRYGQFPDTRPEIGEDVWHKIWDSDNDTHYCHTDDGGATWQGPFLLTGRSIMDTIVEYAIGATGLSDTELNQLSWKSTIAQAGSPVANQCLYIRTRDNYNDGTSSAWRFFAGTTPTSDLTLTATSLVVQEDQDGKLTPGEIGLTASAENLPKSSYSWSGEGVTPNGQTATFSTVGMSDSQTITVTYGGHSDSVTIIKVKEGSDAISIALSNPTMVFNKADTNATEKCSVFVYRGTTQIPYNTADANGWYYTLTESSDKITIDNSGMITVKNPNSNTNLAVKLTLYKGSADNKEERDLSIACQMISTIRLALTNDSGVVVTKADGTGGNFGQNTTTTAKVYDGTKDVTSEWTLSGEPASVNDSFKWTEDPEGTFKIEGMSEDTNTLTITATKGTDTLTTAFTVSKLKQGEPGAGGSDGADAITCYVDSTAGDFFLNTAIGENDETTLTAKIFEGSTEVDPNGENLTYEWYLDDELQTSWGTTKTTTQKINLLLNHTIYFEAFEK